VSLDLKVDERDVEALDRARAAGMHVVACTGRPFPGALPWVERLHLTDPFVCYQGAQVRDRDGAVLLDHGIPHEVAMEVVRWCRERRVHVQGYRDDRLLVEHDTPEGREYAHHSGMTMNVVPDLDRAMGPTTPKIVIVAAEEEIERLLPEVRQRWAGRLYAATSLPTYLEFTNVAADKRKALEFLCRRLGVPREQTVAVGDGRNDLPMIEWAALGVAVSTAAPEVRAAAGGVIGPPGTAGIASLVSELLSG
jgi:Cof subfamily protein (haloacid dehalogenase superfamily)